MTSKLDEILAKLTAEEAGYIRTMIDIDELTGVYNRRFFNVFLEREEHRVLHSVKSGNPIHSSLILIDVDNFKRYQDASQRKHLDGDKALRAVAQIVRASVKDFDDVFRYGGEEFAVICPETNLEQGVKIAERIRVAVAHSDLGLTISAGVSNLTETSVNAVDWVYHADRGLYLAKEKGKNQCCVYRDD